MSDVVRLGADRVRLTRPSPGAEIRACDLGRPSPFADDVRGTGPGGSPAGPLPRQCSAPRRSATSLEMDRSLESSVHVDAGQQGLDRCVRGSRSLVGYAPLRVAIVRGSFAQVAGRSGYGAGAMSSLGHRLAFLTAVSHVLEPRYSASCEPSSPLDRSASRRASSPAGLLPGFAERRPGAASTGPSNATDLRRRRSPGPCADQLRRDSSAARPR